jgi:hypothetical protein
VRTTVEFPDDLLAQAKIQATVAGISLRQFFIEAVQEKLTGRTGKTRRPPPEIGDPNAPPVRTLTGAEIDEALFG